MELDRQRCYQALKARDARFDGAFFVAVATTGIYCRPICTAKLPRAERCTFYSNAALAEQAGYRPCLRCRPELAPGLAVIDATRTAARWAENRIREGALNDSGLDALAVEYGLSARQLRRAVEKEYGVAPVELAQTHRLLMAKQLLTDVASASGFGSVRRFNHLFRARYGLNPMALRRQRKDGVDRQGLSLKLAFRPPLHWGHLTGFLTSRGAAGVEAVSSGHYRRAVRLGGQNGWIDAVLLPGQNQIAVEIASSLMPVLPQLLMQLRRLWDLDANPGVIEAQLSKTPRLRALIRRTPGLRVPGTLDAFELGARAICGQQVSVRAATTLFQRYVEKFGEAIETPFPELTRLPPTASCIAGASLQSLIKLGLTSRRAQTLQAFAKALEGGQVQLDHVTDIEQAMLRMKEIPGIGDWTASYIAMRGLRDSDAFPQGDLGLIRALGLNRPRDLLAAAEGWRPWRAYAALHLWNALHSGG